ncbi:MAG: LamG-like jellyroll fold domain-containing protein [Haloarculaceae archaeon]
MADSRRRMRDDRRAVSKVLGTVLMVAIVLLLATTAAVMATGFTAKLGGPYPQTAFDFEQTSSGIEVSPAHIGQPVDVYINGGKITSFDENDAGKSKLLPVAPGDQIVIKAQDDDRSIIVREKVSEGEAGEFIAFYSFEEGSGSTVTDRTVNDNEATIHDDTTWVDEGGSTGLAFDGSDDYVEVAGLHADETVEEFTVAAKYRIEGGTGDIQQIVEHHPPSGNFEWFLETEDSSADSMEYNIGWGGPNSESVVQSSGVATGTTHVVVGTYDGETMTLYIDGTKIGEKSIEEPIEMGKLLIGADAPSGGSQYLDGKIYELRLYHTSFSQSDAQLLSDVMANELAER